MVPVSAQFSRQIRNNDDYHAGFKSGAIRRQCVIIGGGIGLGIRDFCADADVAETRACYQHIFTLLRCCGVVREGQWILGFLIFGFSIVLPGMKIAVLFSIWNRSRIFSDSETKLFHWLSLLNKWSMLDVFVVAVLLASVKLGALASVEAHAGIYAFAVAVVLIMLVTPRVKRVLKPAR